MHLWEELVAHVYAMLIATMAPQLLATLPLWKNLADAGVAHAYRHGWRYCPLCRAEGHHIQVTNGWNQCQECGVEWRFAENPAQWPDYRERVLALHDVLPAGTPTQLRRRAGLLYNYAMSLRSACASS